MKKTILLICAVLSAAVFNGCSASEAVFYGTGSLQTTVSVRIGADVGSEYYSGDVTVADNFPTAYMALKAAAGYKNLPLEIYAEDTPDIMFLNGVNGVSSKDPLFWTLYVNGKKAEKSMGVTIVEDGDTVEFVYQDKNG